jgi:hypothetical protein
MKRVFSGGMVVVLMFFFLSTALVAADVKSPAKLTAAEIVDKNIAARGGLQAWRAVQSISFTGKIEAGGKANAELPFVLEMKRSHKSRFELQFRGQTAVQVYDGSNGWKVRPFLNRHEVESFTDDEMQRASSQAELDGPLVDYAAKGSKLELVGRERVGDADTYKLKLTLRDGQVRHVWIDSMSFLEVKIDGSPRRMDGKLRPVETFYDEYRPVQGGLVLPYLFQTTVDGVKRGEKIKIESVVVNPPLDDSLFSKPK